VPYTRSIARKEFQQTTGDLITQTKFAALKKNAIPHDIQQCVYRNAIFQSSAALEEYIKSLMEDWIHLLHSHSKTILDIPKELILWAAGKKQKLAFQHYIAFGDEGKFLDNLSKANDFEDLFCSSTLIKSVISQPEHVRDRKYPSKKNIVALFRRFGLRDIFNSIDTRGKKNYKRVLESFSDIRTSIAHEHPTPDLTSDDIKKHLAEISDFIAKIDVVMYSHVSKTSGADCWKIARL